GEESPDGPPPEALQATWEAAQQSAPVLNLAMENLVSAVSSPETLLGKGELHAQMQEAVNTVTETLSTVADQVAVADLKGLTEQEIPVMEIIRPELEVSIRLKLWMLAQTGTEADAAKVEVVTPGEETDSSLITEGVPEKDPISAENQEAIDPPDGKVEGSETETTTSTESGTTDDSTAAEEATDAATEPAQVAKEPTPPDEGAATDASSKEEAPPKTKSTRKKSAK
ncbi:MAG TPA: hypothetical protein DCE41_11940, partial [Cytophagales bacterium]|nr:hypothetical protein [Cytophagales bacterium]